MVFGVNYILISENSSLSFSRCPSNILYSDKSYLKGLSQPNRLLKTIKMNIDYFKYPVNKRIRTSERK